MMKYILSSVAIFSLAMGCASQKAKTEVDRKVSEESVTMTPGETAAKGRDAILQSKYLTEAQKTKILGIMTNTQVKSVALREETARLKAVLFETLGEKNYKADQVAVIKSRLKKIENEKMDLMFSSLDQVKEVLGVSDDEHRNAELRRVYHDLL